MDYTYIVTRINNRRRARALRWKGAILFACVFAGVGLLASVADAMPEPEPQISHDSDVLAACLNGRTISLGDGTVLDCKVRKERMVRT